MTFDSWYRENILRGQEWPFDYQQTDVYKQMKKIYYIGMSVGYRHKGKPNDF